MRALVSYDIDRGDPDFPRILLAVSDCFPAGRISPLTNQTMLVEPITVRQFDRINTQLTKVAAEFAGRLFYVFSLHSDDDPIFGVFRTATPATVVVANGAGGNEQ